MVYNPGEDAVARLLAKEIELSRKLIKTPISFTTVFYAISLLNIQSCSF